MENCRKGSSWVWSGWATRFLVLCSLVAFFFSSPVFARQNHQETHNPIKKRQHLGAAHRTAVPPVQLCVVVRNVRGQTVANLRRSDFRLWDDGRLQRITDFAADIVPAPVENIKIPGTIRYTALYFDDLHYDFTDTIRVTDSAYSYFAHTLGPRNKVGVFTASGEVTLDFTDNPKKLHQALLTIRPHLPLATEAKACPQISDFQAYLLLYANDPLALQIALEDMTGCRNQTGQPDPPLDSLPIARLRQMKQTIDARARQVIAQSEIRSQQTLNGLDHLISKVATLPDPRAIIIASPGFLTGTSSRQVDVLAQQATHLHIIISALDTTGLLRQLSPPAPTHNRRLDEEREALVAAKNQMMADRASMNADVLLDLSTMTGGNFVSNMDDLESGFRATLPLPPAYYVLGFYPTNLRDNGHFHSVRVSVVRHGLMGVQAPSGYYAPGTPSEIVKSSIRNRHSRHRRK